MNDGQLTVRELTSHDDTSLFRCGEDSLDEFLNSYAWIVHKSGGPKTYIALTSEDAIVGYYSIVSSRIERKDAPERLAAGMGGYPIPTTLIARLAVDESYKNQGIGSDLLLHALIVAAQGADRIGCRAVEVNVLKTPSIVLCKVWIQIAGSGQSSFGYVFVNERCQAHTSRWRNSALGATCAEGASTHMYSLRASCVASESSCIYNSI